MSERELKSVYMLLKELPRNKKPGMVLDFEEARALVEYFGTNLLSDRGWIRRLDPPEDKVYWLGGKRYQLTGDFGAPVEGKHEAWLFNGNVCLWNLGSKPAASDDFGNRWILEEVVEKKATEIWNAEDLKAWIAEHGGWNLENAIKASIRHWRTGLEHAGEEGFRGRFHADPDSCGCCQWFQAGAPGGITLCLLSDCAKCPVSCLGEGSAYRSAHHAQRTRDWTVFRTAAQEIIDTLEAALEPKPESKEDKWPGCRFVAIENGKFPPEASTFCFPWHFAPTQYPTTFLGYLWRAPDGSERVSEGQLWCRYSKTWLWVFTSFVGPLETEHGWQPAERVAIALKEE